jgi:hypothetical protein
MIRSASRQPRRLFEKREEVRETLAMPTSYRAKKRPDARQRAIGSLRHWHKQQPCASQKEPPPFPAHSAPQHLSANVV